MNKKIKRFISRKTVTVLSMTTVLSLGLIPGKFPESYVSQKIQGSTVYAASSFSQNNNFTGFLKGYYDTQAMSPTSHNWSRESQFMGDTSGNLKWTKSIALNPQLGAGATIDANGVVYVVSDTTLFAMNPDGTTKWENNKVKAGATVTPVLGGNGLIYVPSFDNKCIYFIDKENGQITTTIPLPNNAGTDITIGSDGSLFFATLDGTLHAYKAFSKDSWTKKWSIPLGSVVNAGPTLASNGNLYVGTFNNTYYAINAGTGQINWTKKFSNIFHGHAIIDSSNNIYIANYDGNLYSLSSKGDTRWTFPINGFASSSPAIDKNGNIYIGSGSGELLSVNANGAMNWSIFTGKPVRTTPLVDANGIVYFGSDNATFYAVEKDGNVKWNYKPKDWKVNQELMLSPTIAEDGTIYTGTFSEIYAFRK
ncbi:PQQ-binding-like beta-propeller repeat protein [Bacillus cereus]|uniref:outer membrane protein assembly factor BamB family protein n=1 Tax=Bacillus cereus TaxID=1396 RepID=UPI003D0050A1